MRKAKRILVIVMLSISMAACSTTNPSSEATIPVDGTEPILSKDGKTVTYGLYPQTRVSDSALITKLDSLREAEANGWYLFDDVFYAKQIARPLFSDYVFDDGSIIVNEMTYWFKCEPIVWNVLDNDNGGYFLLSSILLDAHRYDSISNNYADSEIRAWLNGDFYYSAFSLNDSHILTTTVDNSASTTDSPTNPNASANTQDKVYLPSYQDYLNSSYCFSNSESLSSTRYCITTDWARARGAYCGSPQFNGGYWTRSPMNDYSNYAWYVYDDVCPYGDYVYGEVLCVRPSVSLKLS